MASSSPPYNCSFGFVSPLVYLHIDGNIPPIVLSLVQPQPSPVASTLSEWWAMRGPQPWPFPAQFGPTVAPAILDLTYSASSFSKPSSFLFIANSTIFSFNPLTDSGPVPFAAIPNLYNSSYQYLLLSPKLQVIFALTLNSPYEPTQIAWSSFSLQNGTLLLSGYSNVKPNTLVFDGRSSRFFLDDAFGAIVAIAPHRGWGLRPGYSPPPTLSSHHLPLSRFALTIAAARLGPFFTFSPLPIPSPYDSMFALFLQFLSP